MGPVTVWDGRETIERKPPSAKLAGGNFNFSRLVTSSVHGIEPLVETQFLVL